jgi:hypothetical protein
VRRFSDDVEELRRDVVKDVVYDNTKRSAVSSLVIKKNPVKFVKIDGFLCFTHY